MKKRTMIILILVITIVFLALGIFLGYNQGDESATKKDDSGISPVVWIASFLPIWIIYMNNQSPEHTIRTVLYYCQRMEGRIREDRVAAYISRRFYEHSRYQKLLRFKPANVKKIDIHKQENCLEALVKLKNGKEYTFVLVTRQQDIDPKGSSKWVIYDIKGQEFV